MSRVIVDLENEDNEDVVFVVHKKAISSESSSSDSSSSGEEQSTSIKNNEQHKTISNINLKDSKSSAIVTLSTSEQLLQQRKRQQEQNKLKNDDETVNIDEQTPKVQRDNNDPRLDPKICQITLTSEDIQKRLNAFLERQKQLHNQSNQKEFAQNHSYGIHLIFLVKI